MARLADSDLLAGEALYEEVVRISALGNRFMGTEGERRCRAHLRDALAAAGAEDVHLEPVAYLGSEDARATCRVVGDEDGELACVPLQYTAAASAEGPAIFLGEGEDDDLDEAARRGIDLAGRIVVVAPALIMQRAQALAERGAAGIVNITPTEGDDPGHFTARFHPTPAREAWADWTLPVPGVTVSRRTGHRLLRRLSMGPARLRIDHEARYVPRESANVVATVRGEDRSRFVVVGAHYDSQRDGVGAADNATGLACLLALARMGPALRPRRTIVLAAFAAEEIGAWGARAFAEDRPRAAATIAMVNLDAFGGPVSATRTVIADPALFELASESAAATGWVPEATLDARSAPWADYAPFADAGVPVCCLFRYPPHHPTYHTAGDVPRYVDPARLGRDAAAAANLVLTLAGLPDEHPLVRRARPPAAGAQDGPEAAPGS